MELGWERLLEPEEACSSGSTLCGVDLTSSQMLDSSSTQQTTDVLANFDDESYFPHLDAKFSKFLTQVETTPVDCFLSPSCKEEKWPIPFFKAYRNTSASY